jgi:hypothetical protein
MNKFQLLKDIFKMIDIEIIGRTDLCLIILKQESLKKNKLIVELNDTIPNLKMFYNSSKLTCLHKNSLDKQKFPAVNMFRQILKCNSFKMEPFIISKGYDKFTGKKIVERMYKIIDLENIESYPSTTELGVSSILI